MRVAAFRRLWIARSVSLLGSAVAPIAATFAVLRIEPSAGAVGLVLAARALPQVLLLPLGGVIAAVGPGWGLAIDAVSFAVSAIVIAGVSVPMQVGLTRSGLLRELAAGWGEFRSRTWLWAIVCQFTVLVALGVTAERCRRTSLPLPCPG